MTRTLTQLERIQELLKNAPPMTKADREEQFISLVYGNVALSDPAVTREMVEKIVRERKG